MIPITAIFSALGSRLGRALGLAAGVLTLGLYFWLRGRESGRESERAVQREAERRGRRRADRASQAADAAEDAVEQAEIEAAERIRAERERVRAENEERTRRGKPRRISGGRWLVLLVPALLLSSPGCGPDVRAVSVWPDLPRVEVYPRPELIPWSLTEGEPADWRAIEACWLNELALKNLVERYEAQARAWREFAGKYREVRDGD